jgi:hypothetical protein
MNNKKFFFLITILFISIWGGGCSEDNSTQPDTNNEVQAPAGRFSNIQDKVFTQSCALTGCHGPNNNQANLLLTEGNSYANLVNIQSLLFPQFKRVVPDSSSQSLIIKILKGEVSPRMPLSRDPLPPAVIDSIAAWINRGALNN